MYSNNRDAYRQAFYEAWQKYQKKLPLQAYEKPIVSVIEAHPEYHSLLSKNPSKGINYELEENPFLHMGLHLSVQEQIRLDRPFGIRTLFTSLEAQCPSVHEREHRLLSILAQYMWECQQQGTMMDESVYLQRIQELV